MHTCCWSPHLFTAAFFTAHASPSSQLLEDPDAEPAKPLKLVPLKRYAAALAAAKRAKEAAAAREALVARLRAGVQATALSALYRQAIGLAPVAAQAQAAAEPEDKPAAGAGLPGSLPTVATLTLQGPIYLGPGPATPFNPLTARNPQQVDRAGMCSSGTAGWGCLPC